MFIIALASLLFGYAVSYYAIDAMSHYDSDSKTTLGLPFGAVLGLPGQSGDTAMVFAQWGTSDNGPQTTGAASPAPASSGTPNVNKVIQA